MCTGIIFRMVSNGRIFRVTIFALMALGCTSRAVLKCPDERWVERQAEFRTVRYPDGAVLARGRGLPSGWDDEYERWGSSYKREVAATRIGKWEYFYADGAKRAEVTYEVSCFIQCCSGGPCPQIHDYPIGSFQLWYPSGRKLGDGSFVAVTKHVDTSCEGGDETKVARLAPSSRFWREDGEPLSVDEARASGYLFHGW